MCNFCKGQKVSLWIVMSSSCHHCSLTLLPCSHMHLRAGHFIQGHLRWYLTFTKALVQTQSWDRNFQDTHVWSRVVNEPLSFDLMLSDSVSASLCYWCSANTATYCSGGEFYPQGLMLSILPRRCLEVEKFTMKIYQMMFFFLKGIQGGDDWKKNLHFNLI